MALEEHDFSDSFFQEIEPEWQTAASNVLVALGTKFGDEVMAELLQKLVPGSLPHYFVVLTLANLATENGECFFFVSFSVFKSVNAGSNLL